MKFNVPNAPQDSDIIWRYIGLDKLIDLLISGTIKFTQASIAADKNEISWILQSIQGNQKEKIPYYDNAKFFIDSLRSSTYISCWTKKDNESRSLWANYLDSTKQGVAIKSTVGDFVKSIDWNGHSFTKHIVNYRDEFDQEELQINTTIINTKSSAYFEESELRFTVSGLETIPLVDPNEFDKVFNQYKNSEKPKTLDFDVDLEILINEIMISPFCSNWQGRNIKQLIIDYRPDLKERFTYSRINE
ncbi:MAG: hypothetical protein LPK25_00270 [Cyclobacteriaceae bacterium]|nr:hypothetical protein [Cyclobacteriaceae bacterium]MDX5465273.1 hypothetical protein [Cyclobacteriaceae bacterium]